MDNQQLLNIINYCKLSYEDPSNIKNNLYVFLESSKTDAQCYIFYTFSTLYITFRGTSSIKDWIADLNCSMTSSEIFNNSDIKVHSGFYNQYISIRHDIIRNVIELRNTCNIQNTVICGHSLGGALATLCAFDLKQNLFLYDPLVVTIGAPRVGNKAFSKSYCNLIHKSFRLSNLKDPIPYFPLSFRFNHPHKSICYDKGNIVQKKRLRGFFTRLLAMFKNVNVSSAVDNHSLEKYTDNFLYYV